jgi:hypothetical protein
MSSVCKKWKNTDYIGCCDAMCASKDQKQIFCT